jgi:hypothetical protein
MTKTRQEHIDNIMDYFDFSRVANVMQHLNWRWYHSDTGIPEEPELRQTVRKHLSTVYDYGSQQGKKYTMATGGFVYTYDPQHSEMTLTFELAGWVSHPESGSPF